MAEIDRQALRIFTEKYYWWAPQETALSEPETLIAQVVNAGRYDDLEMLSSQLGALTLQEILESTDVDHFRPRAWAYWHLRLDLGNVDRLTQVPADESADRSVPSSTSSSSSGKPPV